MNGKKHDRPLGKVFKWIIHILFMCLLVCVQNSNEVNGVVVEILRVNATKVWTKDNMSW